MADDLRERQALFSFDTFEHGLTARTLVADLHAPAPAFRMLATSRSRHELQTGHAYRV
jgi:hypothetical protein